MRALAFAQVLVKVLPFGTGWLVRADTFTRLVIESLSRFARGAMLADTLALCSVKVLTSWASDSFIGAYATAFGGVKVLWAGALLLVGAFALTSVAVESLAS